MATFNKTAKIKFLGHTVRMAVFMALFAVALLFIILAMTNMMRIWPAPVKETVAGDEYAMNQALVPPGPSPLIPGGSEIVAGINNSLTQFGSYNTVMKGVAGGMGWGTSMYSKPTLDRTILLEADDDYPANPASSVGLGGALPPQVITREVTLFNV